MNVGICLTIGVVLLSGCRSHQPTRATQTSTPAPALALTPVGQEIQRRGYHATSGVVVAPSAWESATFRLRSKRTFSFRADKPLPNSRDYYCRFSFSEESYDSVDDARHRLANIHLPAPDGPAGERDYLSAMRAGFRVGNVAYVLQTDGSIFWDEVQRLTKELAAATPGAEKED
jgi:hypothetical protein